MSKFRRSAALPLLAMLPLSIALAQSPAATSPPLAAAVSPQGAVVNSAYPGTMTLTVDATDLARRVLHVSQQIPVSPGPVAPGPVAPGPVAQPVRAATPRPAASGPHAEVAWWPAAAKASRCSRKLPSSNARSAASR